MPDVVISIREGMQKLVLLKHDDGRGGGPARIYTHPSSILEIIKKCWKQKGSAVWSVMESAGLFNTEFLHMIISFGLGWCS